ncbi:hypothetical protein ABK040_012438 [Willaertia magna]
MERKIHPSEIKVFRNQPEQYFIGVRKRDLPVKDIGEYFGKIFCVVVTSLTTFFKQEGKNFSDVLSNPSSITMYFDVSNGIADMGVGFFIEKQLDNSQQEKLKELIGKENELGVCTVPTSDLAFYRHTGPYSLLPNLWGQFCGNLNEKYEIVTNNGLSWEENMVHPDNETDENKFVTDLYMQVKRK